MSHAEKKPAYCRIITGNTLSEFIKNIKRVQKTADLLELRIDFLRSPVQSDISNIRAVITKPSIFTLRPKSEGGKYINSEQSRIELIKYALYLKFPYVDIEAFTLHQNDFRKSGSKIIASYHNFKNTPELICLQKKIDEMLGAQADIIKIATHVENTGDLRTLITLMSFRVSKPKIIIGMGNLGRITRIMGPIFNQQIIYVPGNAKLTAPGQLSMKEIKILYNTLHLPYI